MIFIQLQLPFGSPQEENHNHALTLPGAYNAERNSFICAAAPDVLRRCVDARVEHVDVVDGEPILMHYTDPASTIGARGAPGGEERIVYIFFRGKTLTLMLEFHLL